MKFLAALPIVGALLGVASASPVSPLEERGMHHYTNWCNYEYRQKTWSCDDSQWDRHNNCCKNEKKCYYNTWDCRWECCQAKDWDWHNNCPTYYTPKRNGDQQKYHYYGGGDKHAHDNYNDDCKHGRNTQYSHGGSYSDWKSHHGGH